MNEELRREVERWRRYSLEDLQAAQRLIQREDSVPRHPAWLAQQAAEKAMKCALIYLQIEFPRTHNLAALRELLPDDWRLKHVLTDLARLSEYAVEARYPGDLPDLTIEDAASAVEDAALLVDVALADLDKRIP